jgi:hypothetical protein
MMIVEQTVECELAGEIEIIAQNLPQCHVVHHKSHMTCPDPNLGRRRGKLDTNHLSYGTAFNINN